MEAARPQAATCSGARARRLQRRLRRIRSSLKFPEKHFARNRDLKRLGFRSQTMDASEREQYRAAIHGDRDAFEMIIRTHSRTLFAIAYGILQSLENAGACARSRKISCLAGNGHATRGTRCFSETPHCFAFEGNSRGER